MATLAAAQKAGRLMDPLRQRQYLKAMGITTWVSREAEVETGTPVAGSGTLQQPTVPISNAHPSPAIANSPVALLIAAEHQPGVYIDHLANATVDLLASRAAGLLLVIESPAPTAADEELLGKMLAAIGLDLKDQCIACQSATSITGVAAIARECEPKIILTMVGCSGDASLIAAHRGQHFQPDWSSATVAVTHHPADLSRYPELKRPAWEDLKRVKTLLDNQRPA